MQPDIYEGLGVSRLVNKVVEGYHATIFAYGQTGSGKTFTMEGNHEREFDRNNIDQNTGITQRAVMELFEQIQVAKQHNNTKHYSVFASYL